MVSALDSARCQFSSASLRRVDSSLRRRERISTSSFRRASSEKAISTTEESMTSPLLRIVVLLLLLEELGRSLPLGTRLPARIVEETEGMRGTVTSRANAE